MKHPIVVSLAVFVSWVLILPVWGQESRVSGLRQLPGFPGGSSTHVGVFQIGSERRVESWFLGNLVHRGGEGFFRESLHYLPWSFDYQYPYACPVVPRNYSSD